MDDFDTRSVDDDTETPHWRLPGVGVLLVVALLVGCGGILLILHVSKAGSRQVRAIGGDVDYRWNMLSDIVSEFVDIDIGLLARDTDALTVWLAGPDVTDESLAVLNRFPAVEDIYIEESQVTDDGLDQLLSATKLTDLQLYDCPQITDSGLAKLAGLSQLRYLDLEGMEVTGKGIAALSQIETLYLDRCPRVDDATLQRIGRLPNLTDLSLAGTAITDAGLKHLADLPRLNSLTLDQTAVTDEGLAKIVELLPDLVYLSLDNVHGITDEGVLRLSALTSLETLYVHNTRISAEAVQKLAQALPRCDGIHGTDE